MVFQKILQHVIDENETVINSYANVVQKICFEKNEKNPSEKMSVGIIGTVMANKLGGRIDKFRVSYE